MQSAENMFKRDMRGDVTPTASDGRPAGKRVKHINFGAAATGRAASSSWANVVSTDCAPRARTTLGHYTADTPTPQQQQPPSKTKQPPSPASATDTPTPLQQQPAPKTKQPLPPPSATDASTPLQELATKARGGPKTPMQGGSVAPAPGTAATARRQRSPTPRVAAGDSIPDLAKVFGVVSAIETILDTDAYRNAVQESSTLQHMDQQARRSIHELLSEGTNVVLFGPRSAGKSRTASLLSLLAEGELLASSGGHIATTKFITCLRQADVFGVSACLFEAEEMCENLNGSAQPATPQEAAKLRCVVQSAVTEAQRPFSRLDSVASLKACLEATVALLEKIPGVDSALKLIYVEGPFDGGLACKIVDCPGWGLELGKGARRALCELLVGGVGLFCTHSEPAKEDILAAKLLLQDAIDAARGASGVESHTYPLLMSVVRECSDQDLQRSPLQTLRAESRSRFIRNLYDLQEGEALTHEVLQRGDAWSRVVNNFDVLFVNRDLGDTSEATARAKRDRLLERFRSMHLQPLLARAVSFVAHMAISTSPPKRSRNALAASAANEGEEAVLGEWVSEDRVCNIFKTIRQTLDVKAEELLQAAAIGSSRFRERVTKHEARMKHVVWEDGMALAALKLVHLWAVSTYGEHAANGEQVCVPATEVRLPRDDDGSNATLDMLREDLESTWRHIRAPRALASVPPPDAEQRESLGSILASFSAIVQQVKADLQRVEADLQQASPEDESDSDAIGRMHAALIAEVSPRRKKRLLTTHFRRCLAPLESVRNMVLQSTSGSILSTLRVSPAALSLFRSSQELSEYVVKMHDRQDERDSSVATPASRVNCKDSVVNDIHAALSSEDPATAHEEMCSRLESLNTSRRIPAVKGKVLLGTDTCGPLDAVQCVPSALLELGPRGKSPRTCALQMRPRTLRWLAAYMPKLCQAAMEDASMMSEDDAMEEPQGGAAERLSLPRGAWLPIEQPCMPKLAPIVRCIMEKDDIGLFSDGFVTSYKGSLTDESTEMEHFTLLFVRQGLEAGVVERLCGASCQRLAVLLVIVPEDVAPNGGMLLETAVTLMRQEKKPSLAFVPHNLKLVNEWRELTCKTHKSTMVAGVWYEQQCMARMEKKCLDEVRRTLKEKRGGMTRDFLRLGDENAAEVLDEIANETELTCEKLLEMTKGLGPHARAKLLQPLQPWLRLGALKLKSDFRTKAQLLHKPRSFMAHARAGGKYMTIVLLNLHACAGTSFKDKEATPSEAMLEFMKDCLYHSGDQSVRLSTISLLHMVSCLNGRAGE
jgi:hypothetical protein